MIFFNKISKLVIDFDIPEIKLASLGNTKSMETVVKFLSFSDGLARGRWLFQLIASKGLV